MKSVIISISLFCNIWATADLLVFSFDRPLQLHAFLSSTNDLIEGLSTITVLYRSSTAAFKNAYKTVIKDFPQVIFKEHQDKNDFKKMTTDIIVNFPSKYCLFAVDDIIITHECNITECTNALENTGFYGFYLRLGTNITNCYTMDTAKEFPRGIHTGTPNFIPYEQNPEILIFEFGEVPGEWNYPHTVDMTIYKKETIIDFLQQDHNWVHPNSFEGFWATIAPAHSKALCFKESKIINIPFNVVNLDWESRNMGYNKDHFLDLFNKGYRINTKSVYKLLPQAPHHEHPLDTIFVRKPSQAPTTFKKKDQFYLFH